MQRIFQINIQIYQYQKLVLAINHSFLINTTQAFISYLYNTLPFLSMWHQCCCIVDINAQFICTYQEWFFIIFILSNYILISYQNIIILIATLVHSVYFIYILPYKKKVIRDWLTDWHTDYVSCQTTEPILMIFLGWELHFGLGSDST